ncbi:MAG TPA: hypothetical protein VHC90_25505 [Bryobacteraceae bacterium]|nr:hypothetical protein [Bryobacteraceae bacterium]
MRTFTLHLQSATQYEQFPDAVSFIGTDRSGSFGLLAGHSRFMTALTFGLARFRTSVGGWHFVALPGGVAYFTGNQLRVCTRHYLRGSEYRQIRAALDQQFAAEEDQLREVKRSLQKMEQEMFRWLVEIERGQR